MTGAAFLLLLTLTDSGFCKVCSYQDVLDYLNLTADNSMFRLTRPVRDHTHITVVKLDIIVYAILAVVEKTQTFVPFIWTSVQWNNEFISWDPAQFCGITHISVPKDLLWTPDLFIYEMIEKDDSPRYLNVMVNFDGTIIAGDDIRVVTTCKMDVHKFPFDTQECSLSIGSSVYCEKEMRILPSSNSSRVTQFSQQIMKTQGEWEFLHLSVNNSLITYENRSWDMLIYTVTIKRRPLLHVINFLLPILFFLSLDLASFFISDHRGEKLGFKVTVLLAISVLLVILNDILPAMSNRTPLIATYCIVIFALMLLSLLETILVTYLIEKDEFSPQENQESKQKNTNCDKDEEQTICKSICRVAEKERQHEILPVLEEVNSTLPSGESHVLLLILDELKKLQKTVYVHLGNREEKVKMVSWAKRINRSFFICYTVTVFLFLYLIFREWKS
ncbi:5-hydroxytryptamine receptor 3A isoform X2 [Poecilia latipinna]|uniref:5-hydroxytryptamine receptor 3A isoform X2 n=1 Tax=Poecilia latipinna TaxID=48699 RepID=UPI00072DF3B9|nr:PREDICTED: 5-hydroxytryptamine receptor 3A-like isoform X2 [Poecilia latipinna]XP_016532064.1 PREDICTED: 5-hydroxytryptamine receptor 3A-like isoform X4 [Poecilia formosa]